MDTSLIQSGPVGMPPHRFTDRRTFFQEILQNPFHVGAICPSSQRLGQIMASQAGVAQAQTILELGGGSGVITREILAQKSPSAPMFVLEKNEALAETLRRRFPDLAVLQACCQELTPLCQRHGLKEIDCIMSTLPWSLFDDAMQQRVLTSIRQHLAPDGIFATAVTFGPHRLRRGRTLRRHLENTFSQVRPSPVLWANLPPAFVYYCSP